MAVLGCNVQAFAIFVRDGEDFVIHPGVDCLDKIGASLTTADPWTNLAAGILKPILWRLDGRQLHLPRLPGGIRFRRQLLHSGCWARGRADGEITEVIRKMSRPFRGRLKLPPRNIRLFKERL